MIYRIITTGKKQLTRMFVWLISYQLGVLFSQNKSATSNQSAVPLSQNKPASTTSHQPNEQAATEGTERAEK
jgi:hypothetical protein